MKNVSFVPVMLILLGLTLLSGCDSSTGHGAVDLTPPPVPTGLAFVQIMNGSATLTWNVVSDPGLRGYNVYWLAGATMDTLKASSKFVLTNTATIGSLDYQTEYCFAVSSIDMNGNESALSVSRRGTPYNNTPPGAPAGVDLVAENIDSPRITLFWEKNTEPDILHYTIFRALSLIDVKNATVPLTTVTDANYIDTDVAVGVPYFYCVKAVDKDGGASDPSSYVSDLVLPKVTLVSPIIFASVGTTPTFAWQQVSGAKKYNLVLTTSSLGGEIWNVEVDGAMTQIAYTGVTKLIAGKKYYWKVGTISRSEINSMSDIGSFTVIAQ